MGKNSDVRTVGIPITCPCGASLTYYISNVMDKNTLMSDEEFDRLVEKLKREGIKLTICICGEIEKQFQQFTISKENLN